MAARHLIVRFHSGAQAGLHMSNSGCNPVVAFMQAGWVEPQRPSAPRHDLEDPFSASVARFWPSGVATIATFQLR